jgi:hypothetical protein
VAKGGKQEFGVGDDKVVCLWSMSCKIVMPKCNYIIRFKSILLLHPFVNAKDASCDQRMIKILAITKAIEIWSSTLGQFRTVAHTNIHSIEESRRVCKHINIFCKWATAYFTPRKPIQLKVSIPKSEAPIDSSSVDPIFPPDPSPEPPAVCSWYESPNTCCV